MHQEENGMTDQQFVIELGDDQRAVVEGSDTEWLREKLGQQPGPMRLRLRYGDDDTEGHGLGTGVGVRVIADGDDDTEGHAISIHFPSRADADSFRKRLLVTGVLAGTVALGAAGGIGLANMSSEQGASAGAAQTTVTGSDWSQAERRAAPAAAVPGSAWTADERPNAASSGGEASDSETAPSIGGPTPR
jgi:hypothetical protein